MTKTKTKTPRSSASSKNQTKKRTLKDIPEAKKSRSRDSNKKKKESKKRSKKASNTNFELGFKYVPDSKVGVKIKSVTKGSPAEKAGLKAGDIINTFNRKVIRKTSDITNQLKKLSSGKIVKVTYKRKGTVSNTKIRF